MRDSPHEKRLGAYYTPQEVVELLVAWAVASERHARVLDPACGDGRFLEGLPDAVGVDLDPIAVSAAAARAPGATVINEDFFRWASATPDRFDAAVGNPPFIRYQTFKGESRDRALDLCRRHGIDFSALASSWAPFLVAAASLLKDGGRLAFVVPSEIGHAVYARPLVRWFVEHFGQVEVVAIRQKLFPELSEDCWLLRAADFGEAASSLLFTRLDRFHPDESGWMAESVTVEELERWNFRLRPLLATEEMRTVYMETAAGPGSVRLGSVAELGIGYVTGANDFFHLRPSDVKELGIPDEYVKVAVRTNRDLADIQDVTDEVVEQWLAEDRPVLLLHLPCEEPISSSVRRYLDSDAGKKARQAYKCRVRNPWYSVPHVRIPDAFLSLMSNHGPRLVANSAGAVCTNSIHAVHFDDPEELARWIDDWDSSITTFSCEVEGHALGGGLLKVEPREARRIVLEGGVDLTNGKAEILARGVKLLRSWRNGKRNGRSSGSH